MSNLEIQESDLHLEGVLRNAEGSTLDKANRQAVRSVVLNSQNEVALLYVQKHQYHKLPGGGLEDGEDKLGALSREIHEEVGVDVVIGNEIGTVIEHRDQYGQIQTSHAYISHVSGDGIGQNFTELESSQGFKLRWVSLNEAAQVLMNDTPLNYEGRFIQKRDLAILSWAKKALGV